MPIAPRAAGTHASGRECNSIAQVLRRRQRDGEQHATPMIQALPTM